MERDREQRVALHDGAKPSQYPLAAGGAAEFGSYRDRKEEVRARQSRNYMGQPAYQQQERDE